MVNCAYIMCSDCSDSNSTCQCCGEEIIKKEGGNIMGTIKAENSESIVFTTGGKARLEITKAGDFIYNDEKIKDIHNVYGSFVEFFKIANKISN